MTRKKCRDSDDALHRLGTSESKEVGWFAISFKVASDSPSGW